MSIMKRLPFEFAEALTRHRPIFARSSRVCRQHRAPVLCASKTKEREQPESNWQPQRGNRFQGDLTSAVPTLRLSTTGVEPAWRLHSVLNGAPDRWDIADWCTVRDSNPDFSLGRRACSLYTNSALRIRLGSNQRISRLTAECLYQLGHRSRIESPCRDLNPGQYRERVS